MADKNGHPLPGNRMADPRRTERRAVKHLATDGKKGKTRKNYQW